MLEVENGFIVELDFHGFVVPEEEGDESLTFVFSDARRAAECIVSWMSGSNMGNESDGTSNHQQH